MTLAAATHVMSNEYTIKVGGADNEYSAEYLDKTDFLGLDILLIHVRVGEIGGHNNIKNEIGRYIF